MRTELKLLLGPRWTTRLRCLIRGKDLPRWGNLRRLQPFSTQFGFDRGTPVDRHYLHRFLEAHRDRIRGEVLEIQTAGYTRRYGSALRRTDTVDIDPQFQPTYLCDLGRSASVIPSDTYDCFLMPNTLQHLRDVEASLRNALRVVKPGGVILASAAGLIPLIPDGPDYWRLSADGWRELLGRVWPGCEVTVDSHGNCLAAVAAMLGLALEELTAAELDVHDPRYPVLITVACLKPGRLP
ncbi:MAG TPA: methyltransferase domain-containing protein [Methylomirabilota bacterium]|nr:methyltransferase domain-containing protein [Methylomirabilota bacterium]